jgi:hypothetical protein
MTKKISHLIIFFSIFSSSIYAQPGNIKIARLVYQGGGDWYCNPTSLPNLVKFCNQNIGTNLAPPEDVEVGSPNIFNYPFIHMTGHGNVVFSPEEIENLRNYLFSGGFLHIDDCYGMDTFIRPEIKKLFPEYDLVELPFTHPIFHQKYNFNNGVPKIHEHDGKRAQSFGIFHQGRLILLYTYQTDLGDGWEDKEVHKDPDDIRLKALQMGANIIQYVFLGVNQ